MGSMSGTSHWYKRVRVAVAGLLILFVAMSPTLLFGEPLTPFGLIVLAASVFGVGLILRLGGRGEARTLGTMLVVIGVVLLALGAGVLALALGGWGRPY
jgi:hypothetical protein